MIICVIQNPIRFMILKLCCELVNVTINCINCKYFKYFKYNLCMPSTQLHHLLLDYCLYFIKLYPGKEFIAFLQPRS